MAWFTSSQHKAKDPHRRIEAIASLSQARDRKSVRVVMSALGDPVVEVRLEAMRIVVRWRDENTLRALVHLLRDPHPSVRERAIAALRSIGAKDAVSALIPCLGDPVGAVRSEAVETLRFFGWVPNTPEERALDYIGRGQFAKAVALGNAALELLLSFVEHPSMGTRREVAEALGEVRGPQVVAALQKLLADPDSGVRIAAMTSLAHVQPSVAMVSALTRDADKNVRIAATETLGEMKNTEAIPVLTESLKDEHWGVRVAAAMALGAMGERTPMPLLAAGMHDGDPDVRIACAEALGLLGDAEAIPPLILAQLDPESSVRQAALKAVVRVDYRWHRNPRAYRTLPLLKRAARTGDSSVRNSAGELLEQIFGLRRRCFATTTGDPESDRQARAADILMPCLWDDNALLRGAAAETLGHLRSRRAVDVLKVVAQDEHAWVREQAEAALERVADKDAGKGWSPGSAL